MARNRWLTPDEPTSGYVCRSLRIPNSIACLAIVSGALLELTKAYNFEKDGGLTPEDTALIFADTYASYLESRGCLIGTIFSYATANPPDGALVCDGATHLRTDYPDLYSVLAAAFITDADHFIVPDLRGRAVVGTGTGSGLTARSMNDAMGEELHQLNVSEMPSHHHAIGYSPTLVVGPGEVPVTLLSGIFGFNTNDTGADGFHNNMQPSRALGYAIWAR